MSETLQSLTLCPAGSTRTCDPGWDAGSTAAVSGISHDREIDDGHGRTSADLALARSVLSVAVADMKVKWCVNTVQGRPQSLVKVGLSLWSIALHPSSCRSILAEELDNFPCLQFWQSTFSSEDLSAGLLM